jgi:hypothetical protein
MTQTHFTGARRSIQQKMGQIIIVNETSDDADNIFVSYEVFELRGAVFFHPWHLGSFGVVVGRHGCSELFASQFFCFMVWI